MAGVLLDEGLRDRERLAKVESLLEEPHKHVATKADVQAVKSALQSEIAGVRVDVRSVRTELVGVQATLKSEIAGVRYELKSEIFRSELKSLMADIKSDLRWIKWLLGIGFYLGGIISTGILLLLLRMAGGL